MDKVIQNFGKGEVIIPEGARGDRSYKIREGEVLICKKNAQGKIIPIARLHEGEMFGEMYLFDSDGLRSATVVAANDVRVEVYFEEDLRQELQSIAPGIQQMLGTYNRRLQRTTGSYVSLFKDKAMVELPDGTIKITDSRIQR